MYKIILFFIVSSILIYSCTLFSESEYYIEKGIVDLTERIETENFLIALKGEWEFYWLQLLEPKDFERNEYSPQYFQIPGIWNDIKWKYPSNGYATFRLKIRLKETDTLALKILNMASAYRFWINGEEVAKNGNRQN